MFSPTSTNNHPFIIPSSYPFYIEAENDDSNNFIGSSNAGTTFFHDPLGPPPPPNLGLADQCTPMFDQEAHYGVVGGVVPSFAMAAQKAAKKDRHSKIHTSQGLRDRRVRLSSEVARKFFDLQDMLEFDKPSNTLEWLFTKSEGAIKELARSKHSCGCNSNSNSNSNDKCSCHDEEQQDAAAMQHSGASEKSMLGSSDCSWPRGRKLKWAQRGEDVCVQTKKESRDKARARARERTCYKNNIIGVRVQDLEDMCPPHVTQMAQSQPYPYFLGGGGGGGDGFNVIEESITMLKMNHNHLAIPKEDALSFNDIIYDYQHSSFPFSTTNATPIWDTHDNFRGIPTCFMNQW